MTVKTVGLDLAKDVFQIHGISETGRRILTRRSSEQSYWHSSKRYPVVSSVWRRAVLPIIGAVNCSSLAMMSG